MLTKPDNRSVYYPVARGLTTPSKDPNAMTITTVVTAAQEATARHTVLELRQYKIVPGRRDDLIDLFERYFIEGQEATGMRLVGQFRDLDDPHRFTWIRTFPNMSAREKALNSFYYGPVWLTHCDEANPLLFDNDNVLLLKPATAAFAFPTGSGPAPNNSLPVKAGLVVATILYLWKDPSEGFTELFAKKLAPELEAASLPVLGAYVAENSENSFPRLPVRQHEKVFVWFTRIEDLAAYDAAQERLRARPTWRDGLAAALADHEERPAQILRLAPTPRSRLR
ncbi:NIPSNAP family containing protein [Sphingomonas oleivorans]|uniref:NIPSNAP family containing protein n=1 Tax=Sphingomonas oleivorans TaxID=1735121 RepID=A0A2T5G2E1_9SPHN|nr:NIPSNAP family protein [Sphingomonas oleivorans]PTQ13317.1 NIPSNAP family containing protein [Sphingomonas oleivorans]